METIILNTVIVSCIVSALFVMIRVYFCYFAKRNCSNDCECGTTKDGRIGRDSFKIYEVYTSEKQKDLTGAVISDTGLEVAEATTKLKRARKPKHSGEPLGDFALEAISKKKPGRKKKS